MVHKMYEHENQDRYLRFHHAIYLPNHVVEAAEEFLPPPGQPLRLSRHYEEIMDERKLPTIVRMPGTYKIIDVTITKDTAVVFRVVVRFQWGRSDFVTVLEGDWEIVSAYWKNPKDWHSTLDPTPYEPRPPYPSETEQDLLNALEGRDCES